MRWTCTSRRVNLRDRNISRAAFPLNRLVVKANFVHPDPGVGESDGGYAAFVGRLSPEKGLDTLLGAWDSAGHDGAAEDRRRRSAGGRRSSGDRATSEYRMARPMPSAAVYDFIGAKVLVVPSNCYETFGRVAVEAFAKGVPVVGANHGALSAESSIDGRTGIALFKGGDPVDLATTGRGDYFESARSSHQMRKADARKRICRKIYRRAEL